MTSEIRANTLKNRVGLGTVSFTNTGAVVSGIVTIVNSTAEGVTLEDNAGVGNSLKITTPTGYVSIGAGNATFAHLQTDRGIFYFNRRITVDEGIISSYDENLILQSPVNTTRLTINKDTGLVSIVNDLDVDGHTNLDNVNVSGATTCSGGVVFMNSLSLNASNNNYVYFNDKLHFARNGHGTEMVIDTDGDVGIGSLTPGKTLDILSATPAIRLNDGNERIVEIIGGSTSTGPEIRTGYTGDLRIGTNSQERARVSGITGYIGINTTGANNGPAAPLHIYGNSDTAPILAFTRSTTHDDWQGAGIGLDDEGGSYKGALTFYTHGTSGTKNGAIAERLRITSDGKMGLGTDSPSRRLHVKSAGANATQIALIDNDSTNEVFRVGQQSDGDGFLQLLADDGTVGVQFDASGTSYINSGDLLIGRTSSGAHSNANELQIGSGSGTSGLTIFSATSDGGSIYYADGTSGDARYRGFLEYYHASDSLAIGIAGDEKFRFALNGSNGDLRFDIGTGQQAQIAAMSGNGNTYNLGSSGGAAIRFMDTSGSHTIEFDTHWTGYHHSTALKLGKTGSLITRDFRDASIGRDYTSGSVANGQSVNWNGSGADAANGRLNANSIGGNGGGHITCLSVSSQDGNPSGAQIITGVHGQGFNTYVTHASNFDSGISVTFNGTWTIANSSGETIYYRINVIHMGTSTTTYYGR